MQQGTDEWRKARCGSVGASDAPRVVRKIKSGGYSSDRDNLMAEKLIERLTNVPVDGFKSAAMLQGIERQGEARLMYEVVRNVSVEEVAFVPHPRIAHAHCSPDGLVGERGLIEIKCPQPSAHLDTLLNEKVPSDYVVQMSWQMACTGRDWCDYVSFNPDFPPAMRLWTARLARDAPFIRDLEREIEAFNAELERKLQRVTRRYLEAA